MLQTSPRVSAVSFIILSIAFVFTLAFPYYTHANTTLLHEFAGGTDDGQYPDGSLVLNASSTFFGVTTEGGDTGKGTIFSMHITGAAFTLLHEFAGGTDDGQQPEGPLTLDGTTLYGVTSAGGDDNLGTIYSIQTNGTGFTILHEFAGGADDGQYPEGSLVLNGTTLYGVTSAGGDDNLGTIYSIQTNGTGFTILHEFSGGAGDGQQPEGPLTLDGTTLYGTTYKGGDDNLGTIYSIQTNGTGFSLLHEFAGGTDDGALPDDSSLVIDGTTLYGVTSAGGDDNLGTIYSIQTNGTGFTILHEFAGGTDDGSWPTGALTLDVDGVYGVTGGGGYDLVGTIFYINTDGTGFTILHEFAGGADDGDTPGGALTLGGEILYGMTRYGGDSNWGTIFSLPTDTPLTYTITTTASPTGAGTVSCTQNPVPEGENSTCTASPNAGYTFSAWSGDCTGATCTLTNVTSGKSVTASFTQNSYTVTATAGANGNISPSSRNVLYGSTTTFAVTPNTGYSASATGCNGTLSGTTYTTGAITGACAVSASFTRTSSGGGGGGSSSNKKKKPTLTLTASPSSIASGQSSKLTWKSTNATKCVASNGWTGSKSLSSSQTVSPTKTSTYTIACTGAGGTVTKSATVTVAQPVATLTFTASPASVVKGNASTLTWKSTNTSTCLATGGGLFGGWLGLKSSSGSQAVTVTTPTTYTLSCVGIGGVVSKSVTVGITTPPAPTLTFTASPASVVKGNASTLTWKSTNATGCLAAGGWGNPIELSGSRTVSPTKTTTYTLACIGAGGTVKKDVTVAVTPTAPAPKPVAIYPWNKSNCPMVGDLRDNPKIPRTHPDLKYPDYFSTGGADGNGGDGHGYGCRQCASYAAWMVNQENGSYPSWGDAKNFPARAGAEGYATGTKPRVGSLAVTTSTQFPEGHVVWVSEVSQNGKEVTIEQYNKAINGKYGLYSKEVVPASTYQTYIYIRDGKIKK